jgi:hypothetical protein
VCSDVSKELIASIFRVEKSASENPASAGGCRLSHQSETPSYIRTGSEGGWTTWEINREDRGRVCGDGPAGSRPDPVYDRDDIFLGNVDSHKIYTALFIVIAVKKPRSYICAK